MKRRFIIVVNGATAQQQNAVSAIFTNRPNIGYWHWYNDMWLVVDLTNAWTAETLRNKLNEVVPANHKFVSEVGHGMGWAVFGNTETFPWLHNDWTK